MPQAENNLPDNKQPECNMQQILRAESDSSICRLPGSATFHQDERSVREWYFGVCTFSRPIPIQSSFADGFYRSCLQRHSFWDFGSGGCHSHSNLIQIKLIAFACHCNLAGFGSPSPDRFLFTNGIGQPPKVGLAPHHFIHSDYFIGFADCHDHFILTGLFCQLSIPDDCFKSISFELNKLPFAVLRPSNGPPTSSRGSMKTLPVPTTTPTVEVFEGLKNNCGKRLRLESMKQEKDAYLVRKQDPLRLWGLFIPRLAVHVDLLRLRGGFTEDFVI
jgi:hypothetical protein